MVVKRRKKNVRMRGSKTHGWGAMKKHRGAGSRGGRGMAGTGKRGDAKKTKIWKDKKYFGKYGFKRPKKIIIKINAINIKSIERNLESFLLKKLVEKNNDTYVIDLEKLGFNKLLSEGDATKKLNITCSYASKKAVEKIEKAGGKVDVKEKIDVPVQKNKKSKEE
ncbi:MAG: uL15 family ribosomal protein [Candidatus Nanoarchaeia archaeon]|nr:uL15 family ribosomal protein [Candidatus Nanoarchaeia archaeon]